MKAYTLFIFASLLQAFFIFAAAAPAPPKEEWAAGLVVTEFPRHDRQGDNHEQFYVHPDHLGKPISETYVVDSLHPWHWNGERNAIARGYLEIPTDGDYAFHSNSFYDRNLLIVNDQIVCGFRDGEDRVGTLTLKKGRVKILSYGVVESRGSDSGIRVRWKPPGQTELSPIPADQLSHEEDQAARRARLAATQPHATSIISVADDFIVEAYQNGVKIPDNKRKVLEEHHGATTERIDIAVRPGDWLVFHIVHNRLRWEGARYFGVAGLLSPNDFGFVSNPPSSEWSSCDEPAHAAEFIRRRDYGIDKRARAISKVWTEGDGYMRKHAGAGFPGKPVWGQASSTWIKYVAPKAPAKPAAIEPSSAQLFDSLGATLEVGSSRRATPPATVPAPKKWPVQILSATYGTGGKNADVTAAVKEHIEVQQRSFTVSPRDLGADPNPYWNKALHIIYMKDGARREQHRHENETVLSQGFYGPQDAHELRAYLAHTRWIGENGELQFHPDHSLSLPGRDTTPLWEPLSGNSLRITWGPNHKSEYIFNPNRDTFHQIDNAKAAYHLLK